MDAAREHLWGQLLLERNLVARDDLVRLAADRDAVIQRGQDCSLGQLLVQQRRLDATNFAALTREVEGRGRACYGCRRIHLAPRSDEPPTCPQCGGSTSLRPLGVALSGKFQAPSLSGKFTAPAGPAPGQTGHFRAQPQAQQQGGFFPTGQAPTGSFVSRGPAASASGPPAMSGKFTAGHPAGPLTAMRPAAPPPSGGFLAVDPYDPVGSGGPAYTSPPPGGPAPPASTAGEAQEISSGELGVGKRFGKYEIVQELGRGGMGVVYKVRAPGQPGFLAVKVLLAGEFASPKLMERFREEARLAKRLRHPNIVGVHDVGDVDGIPFYAMDFIEGSELQELIRQKNLPVRRGVEILVEVARAAHHAHENGVVHRDLKPSNVLISAAGTSYIMDFGLAKNLEDDKGLTRSGVAIGTPYYMPPEQARGAHKEMDARSDVYALGAILYEILTRRVPFTAKTQNELLRKIVEEEPQPPREVKQGLPVELETICLKALRKTKDERYESALAMAEDLERWLAGQPIAARPEPGWSKLLRKAKKNRTVVLATAGVALLALLSGIVMWQMHRRHVQAEALAKEREQERIERERIEREAREAQAAKDRAAREELDRKRREAAQAAAQGLQKTLEARQVTTVADAMRVLDEAERLLSTAVRLERELAPNQQESATTAYQRALVRRALCRWSDARDDFAVAGKDPTFQARCALARALIKLRWDCDRGGAQTILREAVAATGLPPDAPGRDEEGTAEAIARAYLLYLQGQEDSARRQLVEQQSSRNVMTAEASGALAYIARYEGAPLGGDPHVTRGLPAADQAVLSDGWRYDSRVDRAMLRARQANQTPAQLEAALADLRAARALCPDGELPDLAEAVVFARKGDGQRVQDALRAAETKARRSPKALDEVQAFRRRLTAAMQSTPGQTTTTDTVITRDTEGTASFAQAGQKLEFELDVPADAEAVRVSLRGASVDLDIHMHPGQLAAMPAELGEADRVAAGDSPDETIVLTRTSKPPLRTGRYAVVIRCHQNPPRATNATFRVKFFKRGEPAPRDWKDPREVTLVQYDTRFAQAFQRAVGLRQADFEGAVRALEEIERQGQPQLALIRASWLADKGREEEALRILSTSDELPFLYLRAQVEMRTGKFVESRRDFEAVVRLAPDFLEPRLMLCDMLLRAGEFDEVQKHGDELLRLDPTEPLAVALSAAGLAGRKQPDGVDRLRRVALDEQAEITTRLRALEWTLRAGEAQKTLDLIQELVRSLGERPPLLPVDLLRAEAIAMLGDKAEALDILRTLRARVASNPQLCALVDVTIRRVEGGGR